MVSIGGLALSRVSNRFAVAMAVSSLTGSHRFTIRVSAAESDADAVPA
jgi:hypothetical protein